MTNREKEQFCLFAAAMLAPPDALLVNDLQQEELRTRFVTYAKTWGADPELLFPVFRQHNPEDSLSAMQREYERLFDGKKEGGISLVESTHKPWAEDKSCGVVFALSKGLLMGDCALHMLELYRKSLIEIPDAFRSEPDHLVLELEFLALLYRSGLDEQSRQFIRDHLDWIPDLQRQLNTAGAHDFYRNGIELIHLFLQSEEENGKVIAHG